MKDKNRLQPGPAAMAHLTGEGGTVYVVVTGVGAAIASDGRTLSQLTTPKRSSQRGFGDAKELEERQSCRTSNQFSSS